MSTHLEKSDSAPRSAKLKEKNRAEGTSSAPGILSKGCEVDGKRSWGRASSGGAGVLQPGSCARRDFPSGGRRGGSGLEATLEFEEFRAPADGIEVMVREDLLSPERRAL